MGKGGEAAAPATAAADPAPLRAAAETAGTGTPEAEAWRARATLAAGKDVRGVRRECPFGQPRAGSAVDRWGKGLLRDPRDAPILWLMASLAGYLAAAVPAVAWAGGGGRGHGVGALYLVGLNALFLQRFILGMHYSAHRPLLRKGLPAGVGDWLNAVPVWVLAPFMGIPPGVYGLHHLIMHHGEDNAFPGDLSATEQYQRDNLGHFLVYWLRHTFLGLFELPGYAWRKGRKGMFWKSVLVTVGYVAGTWGAWRLNPTATLWVVVLPFFVCSFPLMFGNWSQHIFVDGSKPRSGYANTYNLANNPDNMKAFNDGYHVLHHLDSKLHWSEFPEQFVARLDKMHANEALSFEDITFFEVGVFVFLGRLEYLATKVITPHGRTQSELVALMKRRLEPFIRESPRAKAA